MEHMDRWGLEKQLRDARLMPPGFPIGELTAYGSLMSEYWHAPAGREVVREFYDQDNERLPQYQMEAVLRQKVAELPSVTMFLGYEAGALEQSEPGVTIAVRNSQTGEGETLRGQYLVGCDGTRSTVREQVGIKATHQNYEKTMLLAIFRSADLSEKLKRFPERSTYRVLRPDLKGFWQFFGRIASPDGWFFHAPVPSDAKLETFDSLGLIQEAAGFPCNCEFESLSFWQMRVAVAENYQVGRVLIAGDAAHSHPPYGGFGLNNGLEDIVNLSWKLAGMLQGWGGPNLLPSYSQERRPVFWETADDFITARIIRDAEFLDRYNPKKDRAEFEAAWAGREGDLGSRFSQYEPSYEASPVVIGPPNGANTAHGHHVVKARAGHHLAPVALSSGQSSFKALGPDFTLLAFDAADSAVLAFTRAASERSVPLKIVRDAQNSGRERYEARLVLVRPDEYVVWSGDDATELEAEEILAKVTGH
jgi:hypothetical protein